MAEVTPEQIKKWKAKHPAIYEIAFDDDKKAYIKKPSRQILSMAMSKSQTNPLAFAEVILKQCFLGGDSEVKDNDDYFLGAASQLEEVMQVKNAQLKKL